MSRERFYGRFREDLLSHEKTASMSALEVHVMIQCRCANAIGLMERSIRRMAREASGPVFDFSCDDIDRALRALVERQLIVWWRELETIWWVEMADEQSQTTPQSRPHFGISAESVWKTGLWKSAKPLPNGTPKWRHQAAEIIPKSQTAPKPT